MRILCLGNNTEDTDVKTRELAQSNLMQCHGLISEIHGPINLTDLSQPGFYHSSVYDLEHHRLVELATQFDKVVVLEQPKEQYSYPDAFYNTIRAADAISKIVPVEYIDPSFNQAINFFENLVQQNKSFCIYPFIELLTVNGNTTVCCRSQTAITTLAELENFNTDPNYLQIRNNMLNGIKMPEHCAACYELESMGVRSTRMQETVEWSNRLGLKDLDDLANIQEPVYYEVRPSNICNLQCRTCGSSCSHLIAKEYHMLGLEKFQPQQYSNFDFVNLSSVKKLYISGGEPTAMPEFYTFLDKCIQNQTTNFEILVNTNATKINFRFQKQLEHFENFQFIISIDGYENLNHYIRWPSDWNTIINNARYLVQKKHFITFNVTVSIYNISTLGKLLMFLEQEFPSCLIHCNYAFPEEEVFSASNFPNKDMVLSGLESITKMKCYRNDPLLQSFIDGYIMHFDKNFKLDIGKLKAFFEFNDKLDQSRNIKLVDYIPELEAARTLI